MLSMLSPLWLHCNLCIYNKLQWSHNVDQYEGMFMYGIKITQLRNHLIKHKNNGTLITNQFTRKAISSDTVSTMTHGIKRGCTLRKVLSPTRSSVSIGPPINRVYSVGPFPSNVLIIFTQCGGSDRITFWDWKNCKIFFWNS